MPSSAIQIKRLFYPLVSTDRYADSRVSGPFAKRLRRRERPVRISGTKPEVGVAYDGEGRLTKHEWLGTVVDLYA